MQDAPSNSPRSLGGALMIALAACGWGTWSLFFRPAEARGVKSAALEAFIVFSVIFVTAMPLALRDRPRRRRPPKVWFWVGCMGVFDALNALLFFWAMQKTTLAVAVLSHYLAPVLVAVGAPLVLGERLTRRRGVALGVALTGLAVLLEPWRELGPGVGIGASLGAGSAVFFAASLLTAKRWGAELAPTEILVWHMPTALATLACFLPEGAFSVDSAALGLLVLGGIGPGAVGGVLFIRGLDRVEASRASILMLLEPVVAVVVGIAFFGEVPRWAVLFGGITVLAGAREVLAPESPVVQESRGDHA